MRWRRPSGKGLTTLNNKDFVLDTMRRYGKAMAADLQRRANELTGTQLNAEDGFLPDFVAACGKMNMLQRSAGFVCRSSAGRVVRLLQPYDSEIYTAEPEELPAQWGFAWSTDPAKALPFIALSTSPYGVGDCCSEDGVVYRSLQANNVWAPSAAPAMWEEVSA